MSDLATPAPEGEVAVSVDEALAQELVERAREEGVEATVADGDSLA